MMTRCRLAMMTCAAVGLLGGCAATPVSSAVDVPAELRVAPPAVLTLQAHAKGVQIYQCSAAKDDAARFDWQLKSPEADLFDQAGVKIGRHYAGPTWEARDGSKVTGTLIARAGAPDPSAIAWLLLSAKSASASGVFSGVQFIQRLHTAGGNAPAGGCNQAAAGQEVRVAYSADYRFFRAGR
jgi:hypothetical protein